MFQSQPHRRSRPPRTELDRVQADEPRYRIGFSPVAWAGISLFVILLTIFLILLIDGRRVAHAAPAKGRPWAAAQAAGDWATVRKLAKAEVDRNPRDAEAQNAYGLALFQTGALEEAEGPLIAAESLSPEIADYKVDLGELYARRGVTELAAGKYREAVELDPSLVDVRRRLARALYTIGDYDASLEELKEITRLEPDNWDAYRLTAAVAMGQRQYNDAIQNLKLYTAVVPDARGWSRMAEAYLSLSPVDTANGRRAAEQALRLDPSDTRAHVALARINLIQASDDAKKYDRALQHYEAAADHALPARDAFFMGRIYSTAKRSPEEAERAFRMAVSVDSTSKDFLNELGSSLMAQQKSEDAVAVYSRLMTVDPTNMSAVANKAQSLLLMKKPDEALATVQAVLLRNENDAGLNKVLADVYLAKGDKSNAKAAYRRVLELSPPSTIGSPAATELGYILWEEGDFAGSIPVLREALRFDECNSRAVLTLGNSYVKLNQVAEAVAVLKRVDATCPANDQVRQMIRALGQ
jgi:tetratricopeptide (TPR) repeat protein